MIICPVCNIPAILVTYPSSEYVCPKCGLVVERYYTFSPSTLRHYREMHSSSTQDSRSSDAITILEKFIDSIVSRIRELCEENNIDESTCGSAIDLFMRNRKLFYGRSSKTIAYISILAVLYMCDRRKFNAMKREFPNKKIIDTYIYSLYNREPTTEKVVCRNKQKDS